MAHVTLFLLDFTANLETSKNECILADVNQGFISMCIRAKKSLVLVIGIALVVLASKAQSPVPAPRIALPQDVKLGKSSYSIQRGMPYSGIWVTKHVAKFSGGEIMKDQNTRRVWRDSEGRTREEITWRRYTGALATVGRIEDPVAKVRYTWRIEPGRTAIVTETHFAMEDYLVTEVWPNPPLHPSETTPGATIVILRPSRLLSLESRGEKLGPKYLNGVYAEGVRLDDSICTGADECKSGQSHHHISEFWTAPDLNLVIRTYLDDGAGFTEDSELKNIDRSEPESSVFLPPPDLPNRQAPATDAVWSEAYGNN